MYILYSCMLDIYFRNLFQVVSEQNRDATLTFLRRVIFEKTTNETRLSRLIRFNALAVKRQKFPPMKVSKMAISA